MKEPLKPCPFCGGRAIGNNGFYSCDADVELCHFSGFKIEPHHWQNAYCWKQLAEALSERDANKQQSNRWAEAATKAQEELEKAKAEIESQKHCYKLLNEEFENRNSIISEQKRVIEELIAENP